MAVKSLPADSIITLRMNVGKSSVFSFGYIDALLGFTIIQTPEKPDSGIYIAKIISRNPIFLRDIDYTKQNYFYLLPGETYEVTQKDGYSHFEVAGNPTRTNEVNALKALRQHNKASGRFSNFDTEEQYAILEHRNMDLFIRDSFLKRDYLANLQFIEQYSSQNNVSESQQKIFKKFLLYKFAAARLNFHMKNSAKVTAYVLANKSLYDSSQPLVQCDTCSIYPNYDYLTRLFAKVFIADPVQGRIETIYKKYQNNFTGTTREHLLYDLVKFGGMFNETRPNPELAKLFLSQSVDTSLSNHIRTIYHHYNMQFDSADMNASTAATSLSDYNNNRLTWERLLEKYRGKLIYVDLWASWCGPCRSGIPASLALEQRFSEEDFVILFVSIDDNIVDWKKASADHKLAAGESYIIHSPQHSALKKKYNIDFIPRYFLLSKDGKMIDQNAPGPGSENLVQLIQQLL